MISTLPALSTASSQIADGQVLGISISQWENYATFGSLVPIVIGLVIFKFVASAVLRTFILAIALAVGALIFLQRSEISDCVANARANMDQDLTSVSCTILGFDLKVDL